MDSKNENRSSYSTNTVNSDYISISQIQDTGPLWYNIRARVDRVYDPFYSALGTKIYKFVFSDMSGSIVGLAQDAAGEILFKNFKIDMTCEICMFAGSVRNKGDRNHYNHRFELWINDPFKIHPIDFPDLCSSSHNRHKYEVGSIAMIKKKMRLDLVGGEVQTGFHITLEGVQFISGTVYRYLGCQHCQKSIKSRNYAERFLCPKNCQGNFLPVERSTFYRIVDIGLLKGEEELDPIAKCFDREGVRILGHPANFFDDDSQPNIAFQKISMTNKFDVLVTGFFNEYSDWELTLQNICRSSDVAALPMEIEIDSEPIDQDNYYVVGFSTGEIKEPLKVSVKPRSSEQQRIIDMENNSRDVPYQMCSTPVGFVLLINNIEFPAQRRRNGSEVDVMNLTRLFKKLGYTVIQKENVCSKTLNIEIANFVEMFNSKKVDSCFVIVLSHGNVIQMEMSDGVLVNIYKDITYKIADERNERNQGLLGIPKVFIFGSCMEFNLSGDVAKCEYSNDTPSTGDLMTCDKFDAADWMICQSAYPGQASHRHKEYGTYYIYTLVKCIMEEAATYDLVSILNNVEKTMTGRAEGRNRHFVFENYKERRVQACTTTPHMFRKFYFKVPVVNSSCSKRKRH